MTNKAPKSFFRFFNGVFYTLAGVFFVVVILSIFLIYFTFSVADQVVNNTMPSQELISDLQSNIVSLKGSIPAIKSTSSLTIIDSIKAQNATLLKHSYEEIALLKSYSHSSTAADESTAAKLAAIKQLLTNMISEKIEMIRLISVSDTHYVNLEKNLDAVSRLLHAHVAVAESALLKLAGEKSIRAILSLHSVVEISRDIDHLYGLTLRAKIVKDPNTIRAIENDFRTTFRNLSTKVGSPNLDLDERTLKTLYLTYNAVTDDEDYFTSLYEAAQLSLKILERQASLYGILEDLNLTLGPIHSDAIKFNRQATNNLYLLSESALLIVLVISFLSLVAFVYLLLHVFPTQILLPIRKLSNDIVSLTSDYGSTLTFNHSSKEFMEVRKSLDIFQSNAIKLQQKEKDLLAKQSELDKANENLRTFIRVSSHDLRSPLRGIKMLCELIRTEIGSRDFDSAIDRVSQMKKMVERLENLLLSLSEYIRVENLNRSIDLVIFSDLIYEQFQLVAPPVGFVLELNFDVEEISISKVDYSTVIRNLIDNAIKHHDRNAGKIQIQLKSDSDLYYQLEVQDDGPGILKKYQKRVFQPFETLSPKAETFASGMGLTIIKKIVEGHNGIISISSPILDKRGTQFTILWPKVTVKN